MDEAHSLPGFYVGYTSHVAEKCVIWSFGWGGEKKAMGRATTMRAATEAVAAALAAFQREE